jgi:hypothetical protein
MKTILAIIIVFTSFLSFGQSQGSLSGYIINESENTSLPGASIVIHTRNGIQGAISNIDGHFIIKPIEPGRYTVEVSYVGFQTRSVTNIDVRADFDTDLGNLLLSAGIGMDTIIIYGNQKPLINKYDGNIVAIDLTQNKRMPDNRSIMRTIEAISTEFFISDNQREIHFRGSRDDMTAYIIDGVRVPDTRGIPGFAISNTTIYAGGIPAKYGDFTGGVIVIETLGYFDWLSIKQARDRLYWETSQSNTPTEDN